jgi:hypothetical protein
VPEFLPPARDMSMALLAHLFPAITQWDRVEGIPRAHDLSRALRAEVRDPLWMLSRQWQMGEFIGDDAGSPVFAKLHLGTTRLTGYRPGDRPEQAFDDTVPLEARVEQRPIPFVAGGQTLALDLRVLMGRQWSKLLAREGLATTYALDFRRAFPVEQPDPTDPADAGVCAHREVWQHQAAFAARAMDGYLWYRWLRDHPSPRTFAGVPAPLAIAPGDAATLDALGERFVAWFDRLIDQPLTPDENAWDPPRLEYRFGCSAPAAGGRRELVAEEYYRGDLDWWSLDVGAAGEAAPLRPEVRGTVTRSFIPTAVEFGGMANPRWWSFEDGRVNFGAIAPDTTDIAKLLLLEFGLVYSNDWFLVPVPLEAGTIAEVLGLVVTNVFGERLWIDPAGRAPEQVWQRWSMFRLSHAPGVSARMPDQSLLLLPTVPKVQEGPALEECVLLRDEMANMVWGIEATVPLPNGPGRSGSGAAAETAAFYRRLLGTPGPVVPPLENDAKVRYEVMNSVPEHWIPFIPVHVEGSNREIQLQRASMPRIIENDPTPPAKVKPRTSLLREGLDRTPQRPYFVHEEEVPRAGIRVSQAYHRTRWTDGRVVVWLGARKRVGRGEGSSGLMFDRLVEVKKT